MSDDTLSLYFGLKEGATADLEVVAQAALAWVNTLRVTAKGIDPEASVRVHLVDAEDGSLRLNTFLDWVEDRLAGAHEGTSKRPYLRICVVALAGFVVLQAPGVILDWHEVYRRWFSEEEMLSLTDTDREWLEKALIRALSARDFEEARRNFYRTLERDPSIKSIGVAPSRSAPPAVSVPSEHFPERSGLWTLEEDSQERTLHRVETVTLISAVLVKRPRSWTFQIEGLPEFSARMADRRFLAALDDDHVRERLRTGIQMTIRLEIKEVKVDGEWQVVRGGRSVVEVISPEVG